MVDTSYNVKAESGGTSGGLQTCHYNKESFTTKRGDSNNFIIWIDLNKNRCLRGNYLITLSKIKN